MSGPSVGPAERGARHYYYDYLPAAVGVGGARRTPLYHVALGGGARLHKGRAHTRFVRAPDACIDESAKRTLPRLIEHDAVSLRYFPAKSSARSFYGSRQRRLVTSAGPIRESSFSVRARVVLKPAHKSSLRSRGCRCICRTFYGFLPRVALAGAAYTTC